MNGFFSRWLILDAIYTISPAGLNFTSIALLIISIFGCIMTTIYLLKFILAFQGNDSKSSSRVRDPGFTMWSTTMLLSGLSFIMGIFALSLSWNTFILPSVINIFPQSLISNPWHLTPAPFILILSIAAGIIIYYTKRHTKVIK